MQDLTKTIDKIKTSGALGRSPMYAKLLDYLAEKTVANEFCSEMSIAIEVFNKNEGFDVTSDSTVRVYIHNLRQKLDAYYQGAGKTEAERLIVPKGSYRLVLENRVSLTQPEERSSIKQGRRSAILFTCTGFAIGLLTYFLFSLSLKESSDFSKEQQLFWGNTISDDKPVMIVIGDYYIFGEDRRDGAIRLVREFDINSPSDLRESRANSNLDGTDNRFDMELTYLPRGSAYALSRVQEVLHKAGKRPRITMMSEFSAEDMRLNHVIYLGYLSGLSVLESYTFSASRFDIGFSYDDLIDTTTGNNYRSNLIAATEDRNFVDYGIISRLSSSEGNQIIILAGTRDAGLMEMSDLALSPQILQRIELQPEPNQSLISMFEVYGFNLTNISSVLIGSEPLDTEQIWGR